MPSTAYKVFQLEPTVIIPREAKEEMVAARLGKTDVIDTKHPKATNGLQLRVEQLAFI